MSTMDGKRVNYEEKNVIINTGTRAEFETIPGRPTRNANSL
jgi:hypothetical protein